MRDLIEALCDDGCAGRATATEGGLRARGLVLEALRAAGCDPAAQSVPACGGANVLATVRGDVDRYVLVAAHYDHLGRSGSAIYRGADDNAAAVSVLVEVARRLAARLPAGRGVVLAAFDAEEPPYFMSGAMGSQHFVRAPTVPLDRIDQMICMDLVGHFLGPEGAPSAVRDSLFALGSERSRGTGALVDAMHDAVPGVVARRLDASVIPPLSDYLAFWEQRVPFVFLTAGRWRHYHTVEDTPDKLAYGKLEATATWLEAFVRRLCARDDDGRFTDDRDDASTLRSTLALCEALGPISAEAALGSRLTRELLRACDAQGRLPAERREQALVLIGSLESRLA